MVKWMFKTEGDQDVILMLHCYFVPNVKARDLSPQRIFNQQCGVCGRYVLEEDFNILLQLRNTFTFQSKVNLGIISTDNSKHDSSTKGLSPLALLVWSYGDAMVEGSSL